MGYQLSQNQINHIQSLMNNEEYYLAYRYISEQIDTAVQNNQVSRETQRWFEWAEHINGDYDSFINNYARTYAKMGASLDGLTLTDEQFQDASNNIAINVLTDILNAGEIPESPENIILADIALGSEGMGIDLEDFPGTLVANMLFDTDTLGELILDGQNGAVWEQVSTVGEQVLKHMALMGAISAGGLAEALADPRKFADIFDAAREVTGNNTFRDILGEIGSDIREFYQGMIDDFGWPTGSPSSGNGPFGIPLPPWFPGIGNPFDDAEDAPPPRTSPIVLDLGATGIDLAAVNTAGSVYWDIDNDNFAEASDWVGPEDGLLCIDLNDDGTINNHSELFGTATTNGYTILDGYDTNNDNYITSADTQFGDLLVWVDANSDGISQSGELHTLSSLGITSIRTTYSNVNYTIDGVQVKQQSDFTMNGVTRTSVDAWFAVDAANSEYPGSYDLDVRTLFLPTLRGFGDLKDLHVAMSSDENLLEMVQDIATADLAEVFDPTFDLRGRVEDILIEWAGAEGISPTARGPHFDAQHLKVLEKLMGRLFDSVGSEIDPHTYSGFLLQEAWENLVSSTVGQILGQTAGTALFSDTGTYNAVLGQFDGEYVVDISAIENLLDTVEPQGKEIFDFWRNVTDLLNITIGVANLTQTEWDDLDLLIKGSSPSGYIGLEAFMNPIYINPKTTWPTDPNISGDANDNVFYAGAGNLSMTGGLGDDVILTGSGGYQYNAIGGQGNDTYVISAGFGSSATADYITEAVSEGTDTIWFTGGLTVNNLKIWTDSSGNLLLEALGDADDRISITGSNSSTGTNIHQRIERIMFDNGYTINLADGLELTFPDENIANAKGTALDDTFVGGIGNQSMFGYAGNDTFVSGVGQSSFTGGSGNDVYKFNAGFGGTGTYYTSYVTEAASEGTDKIVFTGPTASSDVYSWVTSGTLYFRVGSDAHNAIGILGGSYNASTGYVTNLELVEFLGNSTVYDFTQGLILNDTEDNHDIRGSAQNDTIYGNAGNDTIYGYAGNDVLDGGIGYDTLYGGTGDDTFILAYGFGTDSVREDLSGGTDTIRMTGVTAANVRLWTDSNGSLHLQNKTNLSDHATVNAGSSGGTYQSTIGLYVEQVIFDDNTTWNLTGGLNIEGADSNESLYGTSYNDVIYGHEGTDTLYGNGGNDTLYGGVGNDTLYGGDGTDTLYGGSGADTLNGGAGSDTFRFESGSAFSNIDTISDFTTGSSDKIHIADLLIGYDPLTDLITDFVEITTSGSNSILKVDRDGTAGTYSLSQIATITGVTGLTDEAALVTNGNLIVT